MKKVYFIVFFISCFACLPGNTQVLKSFINSRWILVNNIGKDSIFDQKVLNFIACNNCRAENPLSIKPNLEIYPFFGSNKEGFKYYRRRRGFVFCFNNKIDSLTKMLNLTHDIEGAWKLKCRRNVTTLTFVFMKFKDQNDPNDIGIKNKATYIVSILDAKHMCLIKKE